MTSKQKNRAKLTSAVMATALLTGCSGYGGGMVESSQQITIDSDPNDAAVYANGAEIGTTPLSIRPGDVFQARFTSGSSDTDGIIAFRYVGTLMVRKPGCKDFTTQVNDNILASDIHVKLECDPAYIRDKARAVTPPQAPVTPEKAPSVAPYPSATTPDKTHAVTPTRLPATQKKTPDLSTGNAEQRLLRIESLHDKGLLSDEEYQSLRKRVLDTL
jgi:cell division septation protein DedD